MYKRQFADHAYRKKNIYFSAAALVLIVILGIWAGWKYIENERINESNLFHIAQSKINNSSLSEQEKINQEIFALKEFASSSSSSILSIFALMKSGESLARNLQINESISVFKDVINHPEATVLLRNSARLSLAALFEQQKRWDEAETVLESIDSVSYTHLRAPRD